MSQTLTKALNRGRERTQDTYSPETVAQVEENIEGTLHFLRAVLREPALIDRIPRDAQIVLEPDDNPRLAAANRRAGLEAQQSGQPIYLHRVRRILPSATAPTRRGDERIKEASSPRRLSRFYRWSRGGRQGIVARAGRGRSDV